MSRSLSSLTARNRLSHGCKTNSPAAWSRSRTHAAFASVRRTPTHSTLILRARSLKYLPPSPQRDREVVTLFEQAFSKDPTSLYAMTGIAYYLTDAATPFGWGSFESMQRAEHLLEHARAIAPDSEFVLNTYVYWLRTVGRCPEAIELTQQAIQTDSNQTRTWTGIYNELSICKGLTGDTEEALALQQEADRLNPLSSSKVFRYGQMGWASLMLGKDQDAIINLGRSLAISQEPGAAYTPWRYRLLAAAYARTGQLEEAKRYLSKADQLWPYDTVRGGPMYFLSSVYAEQFRRYRDALRLAGERDHVDEDVDFGVPADGVLHSEVAGRTPKEATGVRTIRTMDLVPFLARARPLVVDTVLYLVEPVDSRRGRTAVHGAGRQLHRRGAGPPPQQNAGADRWRSEEADHRSWLELGTLRRT